MKRELIIEYALFNKSGSVFMTAARVSRAVGCTRRYAALVMDELEASGNLDVTRIKYGNHYKNYYSRPEHTKQVKSILVKIGNTIIETSDKNG